MLLHNIDAINYQVKLDSKQNCFDIWFSQDILVQTGLYTTIASRSMSCVVGGEIID